MGKTVVGLLRGSGVEVAKGTCSQAEGGGSPRVEP